MLSDDRPTVANAAPPASAAAIAQIAAASPTTEQPGDTIGLYHLISLLGEGGFGRVWLAERREPFVQRVAVKILKPGMDSHAVLGRFEQERQALAVMDHPSVARVLDAGATPASMGGRPYVVMEYVAGVPITVYCDTHRLSVRQRLELFIPICEAVQHAHHKGIIHRDLKPANILVAEHDSKPLPKVIDFGVAKALSQGLTDETVFTQSGSMIGTPEYMSPEQADVGAGGDIDSRTDVYSLGAVLYELLTGEVPFASKSLRSAGYGEFQRIVREVDPPKPSTRLGNLADETRTAVATRRQADRASLALELKQELDWIPLKCLRKDRNERYSSPADLARDIRNYLEGRPLEAGPESTIYRLRKAVRRNKGLCTAATAVAAALLVGFVLFAIQSYRVGVQRDAAIAARAQAETAESVAKASLALADQERRRAEAINDFIQTALKAGDPNQGGRRDMRVTEAIDSAVREINAGAFKDQPATEAALRFTVAEILNGNTKSAEALPMAQRGLEIARQLHNGDHADIARGLSTVAGCLHTLGRDEEALDLYQQALAMDLRLHPPPSSDHIDTMQAYRHLGVCLQALGKPAEAITNFKNALAMARRLNAGDNEQTALVLENLGYCLQSTGQPDDGLPYIEESLAMVERLHPGDDNEKARVMSQVGFCLQLVGRTEDALAKHQAVLDMRRRMFKNDQPTVANSMANVANVLMLLGRYGEALPLFEECIAMRRRLFASDNVELAHALNGLGRCTALSGKNIEAEPILRESVAMYGRVNSGDNRFLADALANLAQCLASQGKHDEALSNAEQAAAMADRILPETAPVRRKCDSLLATLRKRADDPKTKGGKR
jgi:serine/threonine protein kinase